MNIAQISPEIMMCLLNKNVNKNVSEKLVVLAFRTVMKMTIVLGIVTFAWMII